MTAGPAPTRKPPLHPMTRAALVVGGLCCLAQALFLVHFGPFRGIAGVALIALAGLAWLALSIVAVVRDGRRGLWALAAAPFILAVPLLSVVLLAGPGCGHGGCG
ncbi:hypothetical protein [Phenylobacterium sp.]|uniref:hypothetical protein n=1 Tax=Phenylobacterium sp. TaxID=1871053 RepID=UPI00286BAC87|nr:hypothetical protein [Phenylobacterium sp.]